MEKQIAKNGSAASLPTIAVNTKYPEIWMLIRSMLDGRFRLDHDGESDAVIEDAEGSNALLIRSPHASALLERPFSKESLEHVLKEVLPDESSVGFTADEEHRLAILNDRQVKLTPTEFRLFSAILENDGEFISPKELSEKVWGRYDRNLCTVHVSYLRRKLDDAFGAGSLITVSKKGYRLKDISPHIYSTERT